MTSEEMKRTLQLILQQQKATEARIEHMEETVAALVLTIQRLIEIMRHTDARTNRMTALPNPSGELSGEKVMK